MTGEHASAAGPGGSSRELGLVEDFGYSFVLHHPTALLGHRAMGPA